MSEPVFDLHRPDPSPFPPTPSLGKRIVLGLAVVLVSAAAVALEHVGRIVQHDLHVAVDHVVHHPVAEHCGPPEGR